MFAASVTGMPGSLGALGLSLPNSIGTAAQDDVPITSDPRVKKLLKLTIDTAIAAGASYADMRLTHTKIRDTGWTTYGAVGLADYKVGHGGSQPREMEEISVGVRALVKGYWGFAGGPIWTMEEGERLGREAARQARANTLGKLRPTTLAPVPVVENGSWTMPVAIDPFTIHPSQAADIFTGIAVHAAGRIFGSDGSCRATFKRQDRAVATSAGTYFTQRTYETAGWFNIRMPDGSTIGADFLGPAGVGFELMDADRIHANIDPMVEEWKWNRSLPALPLDVGRFETVLGADAVGQFLSGTIGAATELDRVLGYEANASGTSYINDPIAMLGTYKVGSPHLSVTADRTMRGGLATVQWDDEGVVPVATALVTNGILTNFQTTREGAAWLASEKPGMESKSPGCAFSPTGVEAPMTHTANLVMHPGAEALDFDTMVKSMKKGIAMKSVNVWSVDFQQLNGLAKPLACYEVVNGKIVSRLLKGAIMFRSPEFWKGIIAVGGPGTERSTSGAESKGEPEQLSMHTVRAVPVYHEGLTFIDPSRKA